MATASFGLAETYVMRKLYKEKMEQRAHEQEGEKNTHMKIISTTKTSLENETSSGCFSWFSKKQHNSRISDYNGTEAANYS